VAKRNRPNPLWTLLKLIAALALCGVLAAGFFLPYVGGAGLTARVASDKFLDTKCDLVEDPLPQKTTLYAADGVNKIAEFFTDNRKIVPLSQVPKLLQQALIATEDRRFYSHHGVDLRGLARAALNQSGGETQGASTLTQQYVKQVRFYQAKTPEEQQAAIAVDINRKIYEAKCALKIEDEYSKDQILEKYLNIAFFGEQSYGIETAAQTYFGVDVSKLTVAQAALLVGLVQSPTKYDPFINLKDATDRRNLVLDNMVTEKYLPEADAAAAKAQPVTLAARQPVARGCSYSNIANTANQASIFNIGFFCDYARDWLLNTGGMTDASLDTGGLSIVTSIDAGLQNQVQQTLWDEQPADKVSTALMPVLDPSTGYIRAFAASKNYGVVPGNAAYTTDPIISTGYAGTGSTYKYFTMLAALKAGFSPELSLTSNPTSASTSEYKPKNCPQKGDDLKGIHNAGIYNPTLTLRAATVQSSNTYFVALEDQVFNCQTSVVVNTALDLGINSLNLPDGSTPGKSIGQATSDEQRYTVTLGQTPTSALELASAYGVSANDGILCPPTPIVSIKTPDGKDVAYKKPVCVRKLDAYVAREAVDILQGDTRSGGTASAAFPGYYNAGGSAVAGKTGTDNDAADQCNSALWFVGITPKLVASTALVNTKSPKDPMYDAPGHQGSCGQAFGAVSAGIWVDALRSTISQTKWTWPSFNTIDNSVNVPSVIGRSLNDAKAILAQAGFTNVPAPVSCSPATTVAAGLVAGYSPKRGVPGNDTIVNICLSNGKTIPSATPSTTAPTLTPGAPAVPGGPVATRTN
jgi:membrane peptidoglycan carboxypeptidase